MCRLWGVHTPQLCIPPVRLFLLLQQLDNGCYLNKLILLSCATDSQLSPHACNLNLPPYTPQAVTNTNIIYVYIGLDININMNRYRYKNNKICIDININVNTNINISIIIIINI